MSTVRRIDTSRPNVARVYDALAGGHANFAADRDEAGRLLEACPRLPALVRENRAFLGRAVTWAAGQGVAQFVDLGTGLPLHPAVHESARTVIPGARVAYVDNDAMVCSHVQALLATDKRVQAVAADLADPGAVLADPALQAVIDPGEPVCVILGLVLNLMPAARARKIVAGYARLIPPGSLMAVSCARFDDELVWKQVRAACTAAVPRNHSRGQVTGFLAGLEFVAPGLTVAQGWRGGWHDVRVTPPGPAYVLAGIAHKRQAGGQGSAS